MLPYDKFVKQKQEKEATVEEIVKNHRIVHENIVRKIVCQTKTWKRKLCQTQHRNKTIELIVKIRHSLL